MDDYIIYGRADCEYCLKAIQLCTENGASFSFINMTSKSLSKEQLSEQLSLPVKTVPQVTFNGAYISGSDALEQHFTP